MKNQITQLAFAIIAFIGLTLLMSYTKPAADEPKQYAIVIGQSLATVAKSRENLETLVNQKLSEGWHCQGGVTLDHGQFIQGMVK